MMERAEDPVPDGQCHAEIPVMVLFAFRVVELVLGGRHQKAFDGPRIAYGNMRMAKVGAEAVKGHNEYVDAEDGQKIDLIAEQEHETGD